MVTRSEDVFDVARKSLGNAGKLFEDFLLPQELGRVWAEAARETGTSGVFARFLAGLQVEYQIPEEELRRIPARGPVVVVANHPFGLVEGAILGALMQRVRPDVKILANSLLAGIPQLRECLFAVDPFGGAAGANWRPLRKSLEWLRSGGMLVTFPSGEVSSLQLPRWEIADPNWNKNVSRLIKLSGAASIPVFFHGTNGAGFQIAGLIHPRLRTALLPRELLNKRGHSIRVSIGRPIGSECLTQLSTDGRATEYLWQRTHILQARSAAKRWRIEPRQAPIAGAVEPRLMRAEVEQLPAAQKLLENGEYRVCIATADQIPNTLREIGRLREIAFRQAGEGTGRSLDLDRFDSHYRHLWIWNTNWSEVAGAYRLAGTDEVLARGLYTSTCFASGQGCSKACTRRLS